MGVFSGQTTSWMYGTPNGKTYVAKNIVIQDSLILNLDSTASGSYSGIGTTWTDLSNQNNDGYINGPTYSSAKDSFYFDGYNDRVECGTITEIDSSELTLEAWVNVNSFTSNDGDTTGFIIQGGESYLHLDLAAVASGSFRYRLGGSAAGTITTSGISTNTWYHLLGTYDGSTMKLYVNNSSVGTKTVTRSLPTSMNIDLGRYAVADQNAFQYDGYIAVVRIYNDVLTDDERETNFNAYKERFGI